MNFKQLSDTYSVSPQITPEDVIAIKEAGFKSVICNRPDGENPPVLHIAALQQAVTDAGLTFAENPFDASSFSDEHITKQTQLLAALEAPVFAYCASGNRCSIVWAFTQAGNLATDDIIESIEAAGYQAAHLRAQLDNFSG